MTTNLLGQPESFDRTQLLATNTSPAAMAVKALRMAVATVGTDMDAWERHSARADKFMALPGFDRVEFSRLAKAYGVD